MDAQLIQTNATEHGERLVEEIWDGSIADDVRSWWAAQPPAASPRLWDGIESYASAWGENTWPQEPYLPPSPPPTSPPDETGVPGNTAAPPPTAPPPPSAGPSASNTARAPVDGGGVPPATPPAERRAAEGIWDGSIADDVLSWWAAQPPAATPRQWDGIESYASAWGLEAET